MNEPFRFAMKKKAEFKYPELGNVLDSLEYEAANFDDAALKDNKPDDDKSYTFETHPFYSQINDLSDIEIPDSDIY